MSIKISRTIANEFIDSMAKGESDALSNLQNSSKFQEKICRLLGEFIATNGEYMARLSLTQENALTRVKARGLEINTVIDVGASDGRWSAMVQDNFFPESHFLAIEGFEVWRDKLEQRKQSVKNFDYLIAAGGDTVGSIYFQKNPDSPTKGHAYHRKIDDRYQEVPQTTIDHEVKNRGLKGPYMVKLDTHGQEKEILNGTIKTLEETNLLVVEVYNFNDRGRMRFHEMCFFLEERGFRCADIAEPIFRAYDKMFWQCDMIFIRADRKEFSHKGY
ncbi:MAG: FkbM family methyltransferase [bacterium]|nr:FkbM family methyltransferase [bacterium]